MNGKLNNGNGSEWLNINHREVGEVGWSELEDYGFNICFTLISLLKLID